VFDQAYSPVKTISELSVEQVPNSWYTPYAYVVLDMARFCNAHDLICVHLGGVLCSVHPETMIQIRVSSNSFLYHQVRNIVGLLHEVGRGRISANQTIALLNARDRSLAPLMAPAHGLYLVNVAYDQPEASATTSNPES
jgi:tRNA U38,U39,U40 pseudouridine synthase TruA